MKIEFLDLLVKASVPAIVVIGLYFFRTRNTGKQVQDTALTTRDLRRILRPSPPDYKPVKNAPQSCASPVTMYLQVAPDLHDPYEVMSHARPSVEVG